MRWVCIFILVLLASLVQTKVVSAYTHDTISDIAVPRNVTWGTQIEWQGHIVYEVKDMGTTYQVKVARDGEPHQFPYFYVSFSKGWEYLGTVKHVNPEAERRAAEDARRRAEEAERRKQEEQRSAEQRQREEQARQEEERRRQEERDRQEREKPDPPVTKPPDEEEEEPEPDNPEE